MITDALLQLSSAQVVTATAVSTNTIDLTESRDIGAGEDLYAIFNVNATATAAGSATVTFQVVSSAAADLSSNTVLCETAPIAIADLVAGRIPLSLPIAPSLLTSLPKGQRYLGAQYTIATGPLLTGKFDAMIADTEVTNNKFYPSGFSVV